MAATNVLDLDFIFKTRGIDYVLCDDFVAFERLDGQRLNYSDRHFENVKKAKWQNPLSKQFK